MHQLFTESPLQPGGELVIPGFKRVRDGLQLSLNKVIEYRRQNPMGLNASHFLVRLIQSINVPITMELDRYVDKVRDNALNLAMSLRMTSALSQGRVFDPGVFYGKFVTEVLVANIDPFDVASFETNWRDAQSIRVLFHPKTELWMEIPDGRFPSDEAGIAVISINIPLLAAQYKMWRLNRLEVSDDTPRTTMQFLNEIALPNMLHSHIDWAITNRLIGRFFEIDFVKTKPRHPFYLTDWTEEVDRLLDIFLKYIRNRKWSFDTIVSHIPTVSNESFYDIIRLPDMAFSQQVQWAVVLARLSLVIFLVQFNKEYDNPRNQFYLNYLRRYLRQMDLNRTMRVALPSDRYDDVMVMINRGIVPFL